MPVTPTSMADRFWAKVVIAASDACWEWSGGLGTNGYGYIGAGTREHGIISAHRFSFELHNKRQVTPGLIVCHRCSNKRCVNPAHLFEGTYTDNLLQAFAEGAQPRTRRRKGRRA